MKKFYWIIFFGLLILVAFSNINLLKYKKKFKEAQEQNIYYYQDNFNFIENQDIPYLFITDSSLVIKDMYAPFENYPDLNTFYYNAIIQKYF